MAPRDKNISSRSNKVIRVAIIFGGCSPEHNESIRAAQYLYQEVILPLLKKYIFGYFYLDRNNQWATEKESKNLIKGTIEDVKTFDPRRILDLQSANVIYNTMMGSCGENGNIMGLADLYRIPMIGCDITASSVCQDKNLTKILVKTLGIPIVDYFVVRRETSSDEIVSQHAEKKIGFPCFVKPTNLGTCAHVFRAENKEDLKKKWERVRIKNQESQEYLVEKYIPNIEVRILVMENGKGYLDTNDLYVTTLKEGALDRKSGALFDHQRNTLPREVRRKMCQYAKEIFRLIGMKDYARIDFFVKEEKEDGSYKIYFNEVNTQPYLGSTNISLIKGQQGVTFAQLFEMFIRKNYRLR